MLKKLFISALAVPMICSCASHFISEKNFRDNVASDFASRSEILHAAGVDLASMNLSLDEQEALEFLYAYMPLGDMVNQSSEFWLDNYRLTRQAVETLSLIHI